MRGAECHTDHKIVRSTLKLHIKTPVMKCNNQTSKKIDVAKLKCHATKVIFQCRVAEPVEEYSIMETNCPSVKWTHVHSVVYEMAVDMLGIVSHKQPDRFAENIQELHLLIERKNEAYWSFIN